MPSQPDPNRPGHFPRPSRSHRSDPSQLRRKNGCLLILMVAALGLVLFAMSPAGKAIRTLLGLAAEKSTNGTALFEGGTQDRLKVIYEAAMSYHRSEEMFPKGETWNADLLARMKTADLKPGEAEKKLIRPGVGPGQFGYAMNKEIAGKYKGDLPGPKIILFFESTNLAPNAVGDPKTDAVIGGWFVRLDGTISNGPQ